MLIRIGTRGSKLALAQAEMVRAALIPLGFTVETVLISTLGDKKQGTEAAKVSDKKEWVYELECALLSGEIDAAVHSGKDVPIDIEAGTTLASCLRRASPQDVFIGRLDPRTGKRLRFDNIGPGDTIGTASLRRAAQLMRLRTGIVLREHRGNVTTRIDKLDADPSLSGIVLAYAGIQRLGMKELEVEPFSFEEILPAVCQGTLAIQYRSDDKALESAAAKLQDPATERSFKAERSCVATLEADCHSALSVFAEIGESETTLTARVLSRDGLQCLEERSASTAGAEISLGERVADSLIKRNAKDLLFS